jgi:amidase
MDDLGTYDAIGLGELVRRPKISPTELLEDTIRRIEAVNPRLNAVICPLWERARAEARKRTEKGAAPGERFPGVPYLLKDLVTDMKGAPFADGSRFVHGYVSAVDSELVSRALRRRGDALPARRATGEGAAVGWTAASSALQRRPVCREITSRARGTDTASVWRADLCDLTSGTRTGGRSPFPGRRRFWLMVLP